MGKKIFLELLNTSNAHRGLARQGFNRLELSDGQPKVFNILYYTEGIVQKDLAKICGVKASTLTTILARMEKQGYIRKEKVLVSGGKRAFSIYLTEEGKKKAQQVIDLVEELEEKSFAGFSQEEIDTLFALLEKVQNNLKD